jgi:hypothetical protein
VRLSRPVSDYFLLTLAAQVTSLPVILYHFGRLLLTSLLANPAGADDPRSQPDPETLQAVEGYTLLRTDRNGWIHIETDGEKLKCYFYIINVYL